MHVSGPLAMVVAGLMIGNQGRALAMSDTTCLQMILATEAFCTDLVDIFAPR